MARTTTGLLIDLVQIKVEEAQLAQRKEQVEKDLVEALEAAGDKTVSVNIDGHIAKGTLVKGTRVVIDAERLKKALPARIWGKVTKQVVDNTLLEAAVAIGDVDANVVADCSTVNDVRPFVRVTGDTAGVAASVGAPTNGAAPKKRAVKPRTA